MMSVPGVGKGDEEMIGKIRLNKEYVVEQIPNVGWHIFAYFENEGRIHQDQQAGSIVLDEDGMMTLVLAFCDTIGGYDLWQGPWEKERNDNTNS